METPRRKETLWLDERRGEAVEFQKDLSLKNLQSLPEKLLPDLLPDKFSRCPLFLLARMRARKDYLLRVAYFSMRGYVTSASRLPLAAGMSFTKPPR